MDSLFHTKLSIRSLVSLGLAALWLAAGCCLIGSSQDGGDADNGSASNGGDGDNGVPDDANDVPPPTDIVVEAIVRTGDEVPGQSGATFTYFGNPIIDAAGRVAFYAAYEGGRGDAGLYVWENGTLQRIYDTDPVRAGIVPGMGAGNRLGGFTIRWDRGSPHLAWGSNGRLLFAASVNGSPQPNVLFRWRARDGDVLLIGSAEILRAVIPDASGDFLPEFYHPGVSDDGIAIFSNRYSYFRQDGSFSLFNPGIFTTDGRTTQEIGLGAVPGQPASATFSDKPVLVTTHNASGEFLFQAAYESAEGDRGVYLLRNDELFRVIDNAPDRSFPGLPAGAQVGAADENFEALALGGERHIAIDTTLTIDGVTRNTVLLWDGTEWHELQDTDGKSASDLLAGVTDDGQTLYLVDGQPFLGDGQNVVSLSASLPAELTDVDFDWEAFGGALNNHGRALLRYRRQSPVEAPGLALWSGERLFVVIDGTEPFGLEAIDVIFAQEQREPDEMDRVGTVSDRPEVNRPGLSGILNDRDEWVFRAGLIGADGRENTDDDRQAIFLGRGQ